VFTVGGDPDRVDPTYWGLRHRGLRPARNGSKWCNEEYTRLATEQRSKSRSGRSPESCSELQARSMRNAVVAGHQPRLRHRLEQRQMGTT
jgi:peptide/nickel transport system substrate-binding protein